MVGAAKDAGDDSPADATVEAATDASGDAQPLDAAGDVGDADAGVVIDASGCMDFDAKVSSCNTLPPSPLVDVGCAAVPAAAGGTIADGYYLLTSAVVNTAKNDGGCPTGETRKDTIEICGDVLLWLDLDTVNSSYSAALTYTTSGTNVVMKGFCGGSGDTYPYTATPTTLTLYLDYSPTNELVLTLTKQ